LEYHSQTRQFPENLIRSFADLIRFYKGDINDKSIPLKDEPAVLEFFEKVWKKDSQEDIIESVLSNRELWGVDFSKIPELKEGMSFSINIHFNQ
jgi:tagaturonate reductase